MKDVYCPFCGVKLNIKTDAQIDFDIRHANSKVWCIPCQRYVKFSLKGAGAAQTEEEQKKA